MPNGDEAVIRYWPIIVTALTLLVGGVTAFNQISANADEIKENQEKMEAETGRVKKIEEKVIRIEAEQRQQGDDIDEIKDDVKEILKELRER